MKIITHSQIASAGITPRQCIDWVKDSFSMKYDCILPHKISLKLPGNIFYNTMPCYLPKPIDRFGVKEVSRYPGEIPSLSSYLMLFDGTNGNPLALMDADWITAMRTGAVASLAIETLKPSNAKVYSFIGLGNTARATLLCLLESAPGPYIVKLKQYKGQELDFMARFSSYKNVEFQIADTDVELVNGSDVIVSCVTAADRQFAPDIAFQKGCLVVPVHTRGFQNCDLFFDKVFADDKDHVSDFKYFDKFKSFEEFSRVLLGQAKGRENDGERILAYNIGIALHDVLFASRIYDKLAADAPELQMEKVQDKFWI